MQAIEIGRKRGPTTRERLAPLAEALGIGVGELVKAAEEDSGWVVKPWPGMPWQAKELMHDLARGEPPPKWKDPAFWDAWGRKAGYGGQAQPQKASASTSEPRVTREFQQPDDEWDLPERRSARPPAPPAEPPNDRGAAGMLPELADAPKADRLAAAKALMARLEQKP